MVTQDGALAAFQSTLWILKSVRIAGFPVPILAKQGASVDGQISVNDVFYNAGGKPWMEH